MQGLCSELLFRLCNIETTVTLLQFFALLLFFVLSDCFLLLYETELCIFVCIYQCKRVMVSFYSDDCRTLFLFSDL